MNTSAPSILKLTHRFLFPLYWLQSTLLILILSNFPTLTKKIQYNEKPPRKSQSSGFSAKTTWTSFYIFATVFNLYLVFQKPFSSYASTSEFLPLLNILHGIHTAKRLAESVFLTKFNPKRVTPFPLFLVSLIYYITTPLTFYLFHLFSSQLPLSNLTLLSGVILFAIATTLQTVAHVNIRNVKGLGGKLGKYGVVRGGLFEIICCPHYFWEIVAYFSFVSITLT